MISLRINSRNFGDGLKIVKCRSLILALAFATIVGGWFALHQSAGPRDSGGAEADAGESLPSGDLNAISHSGADQHDTPGSLSPDVSAAPERGFDTQEIIIDRDTASVVQSASGTIGVIDDTRQSPSADGVYVDPISGTTQAPVTWGSAHAIPSATSRSLAGRLKVDGDILSADPPAGRDATQINGSSGPKSSVMRSDVANLSSTAVDLSSDTVTAPVVAPKRDTDP